MNSPPNFSLIASTNGLVHGSCCGPFGFGGAAGAAGFAPGGGGGGFGTAAFGSAGFAGSAGLAGSAGVGGSADLTGSTGFAGSAGFGLCSLSFCSSATLRLGRTSIFEERPPHKDVDST